MKSENFFITPKLKRKEIYLKHTWITGDEISASDRWGPGGTETR
jgi:hypothetical protein